MSARLYLTIAAVVAILYALAFRIIPIQASLFFSGFAEARAVVLRRGGIGVGADCLVCEGFSGLACGAQRSQALPHEPLIGCRTTCRLYYIPQLRPRNRGNARACIGHRPPSDGRPSDHLSLVFPLVDLLLLYVSWRLSPIPRRLAPFLGIMHAR